MVRLANMECTPNVFCSIVILHQSSKGLVKTKAKTTPAKHLCIPPIAKGGLRQFLKVSPSNTRSWNSTSFTHKDAT